VDFVRRFAGPGIGFLAGAGLQVSGIEAFRLALAIWGIAVLWVLLALLTWEPVTRRLGYVWRGHEDSVKASAERAGSGKQEFPPAKPETRVTLEHDGLEWEYAGRKTDPRGPFCPDDHTPLAFVNVRANGEPVIPYFHHDAANLGGYWGFLRCLTCNQEYGKDCGYKTVQQSQNEVHRRFEGMENRGEV